MPTPSLKRLAYGPVTACSNCPYSEFQKEGKNGRLYCPKTGKSYPTGERTVPVYCPLPDA